MKEGKKKRTKFEIDKQNESGLSSFVERPVPTEREVRNFEKVLDREVRHQEIDSNLSEIYRDKKGDLINVKKMNVKKRSLSIVRFFRKLIFWAILALAAYFVYFYFFSSSNNVSAMEFKISAPEKVSSGEDFSYSIDYYNPTKFTFTKINLELKYPENFIYASASLNPQGGNYGFNLPDLAPGARGSLTINGKLIAQLASVNILSGRLSYTPLNYSSEYKKENSISTEIKDLGFTADVETSSTVFINSDNELKLILSDVKNNYFGNFNVSFVLPEDVSVEIASSTEKAEVKAAESENKKIEIVKDGVNSWQVSGLNSESGHQEILFKYKVKKKIDLAEIKVRLEKKLDDGQAYVFWEKILNPEIISNDLNLTLFLNGAKNDGAVNFGQPLNYTLSYSNKGNNTFKDMAIMAVVQGDFLDWNSLNVDKKGEVRSNGAIVWTKNELSELAEIKPGQEGEINFSINLKPYNETDLGKNLEITSYAQYSFNNKSIKGEENKSNSIISKINSDLSLVESIRYFNNDNIPVGTGPLPPKVNEKSSFVIYWTVKNNLHELSETRVVLPLPSQVYFDEKANTNVGSIYYDRANNQVIWEIGRLPVSVYRADAEFGIFIKPTENDRNKILVLSPGSAVSAMDTETKDIISKKTDAKTTKLEDDDIAGLNNSGRVE